MKKKFIFFILLIMASSGGFALELNDVPELRLPQTFDQYYYYKNEVPKSYIPVDTEFMDKYSSGNPLQSECFVIGKITLDKKRSILVIYEMNNNIGFINYHLSLINGDKDPVSGKPAAVSFRNGTVKRIGSNITGVRNVLDLSYEDGKNVEKRYQQGYTITSKGKIIEGELKLISTEVKG